MTFVVFATPSALDHMSMNAHYAALETERLLTVAGIGHTDIGIGGDPYLWKVRSKLATKFLKEYPDATDLFFRDDDVGYPATKVLEFLHRPEDIVLGVYPKKNDDLDFPCELEGDPVTRLPIQHDGLVKIVSAGAGFLRIKRGVLERMAETAPTFREIERGVTSEYWGLFAEGIGGDGWAWGEDKSFFNSCRNLGYDIWCDPDIEFTHAGRKKWKANLADHVPGFRTVTEPV